VGREASGADGERMVQRRVLIVHRSPLFRDIMEQLLRTTEEIEVVGATTDVQAGFGLAREGAIDTVIFEAGAEEDEQAASLVARAAQENQELRTIALSLSKTGYSVYSAKSLRNIEPQELLELVLSRSQGEDA